MTGMLYFDLYFFNMHLITNAIESFHGLLVPILYSFFLVGSSSFPIDLKELFLYEEN